MGSSFITLLGQRGVGGGEVSLPWRDHVQKASYLLHSSRQRKRLAWIRHPIEAGRVCFVFFSPASKNSPAPVSPSYAQRHTLRSLRGLKSLFHLSVKVIRYHPGENRRKARSPTTVKVSRCGLVVRRLAGKQKDLGSNPRRLSFLFSSKSVVYGHCLVTLPTQLMKH